MPKTENAAPLDLDAPRIGAAVCGVDCHPGDDLCNGYCSDARVKMPPTVPPPSAPAATRGRMKTVGELLVEAGYTSVDDVRW